MKFSAFLFAILLAGCVRAPKPQAFHPPAPPVLSAAADDDDDDDAKAEAKEEANEREDARDARDFFYRKRMPEGVTQLPIDRYMAARQHIAAMPVYSFAGGTGVSAKALTPAIGGHNWTPLGPGDFGGRTRSLVIDPKNPDTMYAGAVTGGVWKTTDGGQNWTALTDLLPVLNVGALVMDPNDSNTLYAGTGESYQGWPGQGIFKTTNGGTTWVQLSNSTSILYTNKLVMSAVNPGVIYAATSIGVYMSPDAGASWIRMGITTTQAYNGCQDLALRTDTGKDYLYASCTGRSSAASYAIWRNDDAAGAGTWTQMFTAAHMGRTSLAIAPSLQTTIYAMSESIGGDPNYESGLLAVYRSTASGDSGTWIPTVTNADSNVMNTLLLTDARSVITNFCNNGAGPTYVDGQGWYDNVLAVDPTDPNRVWAGGVEVFRSDDGGANWGVASLWQAPIGTNIFAHADRHVILFHPNYNGTTNQSMFLGTDGGLFRTDNARAVVSTGARAACYTDWSNNSVVRWTSLNHSYSVAQFYHGAAYPGGGVYIAGAQDNAPSRGSDLAGLNGWVGFTTGDGTAVGIDPADVNIFFESTQHLALNRSVNGGTLQSAITGITEKSADFPFVPYMAVDPNEGKHVYLGGAAKLWRSVNSAATWSAAAPVETGSSVGAIAISPFDSNTVLFGSGTGYIYRNTSALAADGTTPWSYARPRSGFVSGLAFDPTNPNIVYAGYSTFKSPFYPTDAHVYKSLNGGVTWFASDGSGTSAVPDVPTHQIVVDPRNPQNIYLGTDLGILVSTDGGLTWAHDPNAFSDVIVEELTVDHNAASNWLFAFTYGRGAFRVQLPNSTATNCSYSVGSTSLSATAFGGVFPVTVTAPPGCIWAGLPGTNPAAFGLQSPAQGSGIGQALVLFEPNTGNTPRSDVLNIANTAVAVTQAAPSFAVSDASTAPPAIVVPGVNVVDTRSLTAAASDPVHSCTSTTGFKTAWWTVTPGNSGTLKVTVGGRRYDVFGNSGIVVTAYQAGHVSGVEELACAIVPRDTNAEIDANIMFPVTAATQYVIEVSATSNTASDGGFTTVVVSLAGAATAVSVAPGNASIIAGSAPRTFTAVVTNSQNPGVRWSLSPSIGTISPAGIYTPPPSIDQQATVTLTATSFGDPSKIGTASLVIMPIPVGSVPSVSEVANATGEFPVIAQNAFVQIKGLNLGVNSRSWQGPDFANNQLPTQLDGVSVTVNGKNAYVSYISPGQVNIITPLDSSVGTAQVQVTTKGGASQTIPVQMQAVAPGFFTFDGIHLAATHANGAFIGPTTLYPGITTPAKPGETIVLYGNGFGETNPPIPDGSIAPFGTLLFNPVIRIGGVLASVQFAGLVAPGEYQFNVVVPAGLANGDNQLTATYQNIVTQPGIMIAVQR